MGYVGGTRLLEVAVMVPGVVFGKEGKRGQGLIFV